MGVHTCPTSDLERLTAWQKEDSSSLAWAYDIKHDSPTPRCFALGDPIGKQGFSPIYYPSKSCPK